MKGEVDNMSEKINIDSFAAAVKYAKERLGELGIEEKGKPDFELSEEEAVVAKKYYEYMRDIYEPAGERDFPKYASAVWRDFFQKKPEGGEYEAFKSEFIGQLMDMDFQGMVYPEIWTVFPEFLEKYADKIKKVMLWSIGDVTPSGLQPAKIYRSGIIDHCYKHLIEYIPEGESRDYIKDKTGYMVADDKFQRLDQFLKDTLSDHPEGSIKIVALDDAKHNFEAIERIIEKQGAKKERIEFIPIWAQYGQNLKEEELNTINSITDLLDEKRFAGILENAYLLVDYDGVISDNKQLLLGYIKAFFSSMVSYAAKQKQMPLDQARRFVLERLRNKLER